MTQHTEFLNRRSPSRGRALAGLAVLVAALLGTGLLLVVTVLGLGLGRFFLTDQQREPGAVGLLLTAAAVPLMMLPATLLAARVGLRLAPWQVWSVAGRFRFDRYFRAVCAAAVVVLGVTALQTWLRPAAGILNADWDSAALLAPLLLVVMVQTLAEELLFRGVLVQLVGSVIGGRLIATVIASVLVSVIFALSHGITSPWVLTGQFLAGMLWLWLTQRTGGVETTAGAHAVWNAVLMGSLLLGARPSSGTGPMVAVEALLVDVLVVAGVYLTVARTPLYRFTRSI
ncbi:hypothetical protein CGZ96_20950 [Enemella evansiae]|uniref:CPBP family intramembrane glutamic endopeptidase n=1 Tax=Enemella evansiae TaxID=2016499 RepID=UPI000B97C2D1|nr:CPBP family intramembrane glutamic endopeptidase [Enemella evansiae]OYN93848.1 hypothetical protein CGZ96_20950 [Enemella evansiae]